MIKGRGAAEEGGWGAGEDDLATSWRRRVQRQSVRRRRRHPQPRRQHGMEWWRFRENQEIWFTQPRDHTFRYHVVNRNYGIHLALEVTESAWFPRPLVTEDKLSKTVQ